MTIPRFRLFSLVGLLALGVLAGAGGVWYARGAAAAAPKKQLYTCPMHPMVVQDHPGRCPICGMNLVPMAPRAKKSSTLPSCGAAGAAPGGCCGGASPEPSK